MDLIIEKIETNECSNMIKKFSKRLLSQPILDGFFDDINEFYQYKISIRDNLSDVVSIIQKQGIQQLMQYD